MMEWFRNIGTWFYENKDAVLLWFTSGQFFSILVTVFMLVRNVKATKSNTASSDTLQASLVKTEQTAKDAGDCKSNTDSLMVKSAELSCKIDEVESKMSNDLACVATKLNAMLEVMGVVYSTIKDERVRNTVSSLLINAKYNENSTRAELQKQVEELKETIRVQLEQLNKDVEERVETVSAVVNGETQNPERY